MTWIYQGQVVEELPDDCVGFVYIITNTISGRKYIGKKLSKFSKTTYKTVKLKNGTKKKKRIKSKIDSDWQTYWGSEEMSIPYRSPLDNRVHRYFPDFIAKMRKSDGTTFIRMIEVKPLKQTVEPQRPKDKKTTKKYIREVSTYLVNRAKWDAAEALCKDKGWEFTKITEEELFPRQPK